MVLAENRRNKDSIRSSYVVKNRREKQILHGMKGFQPPIEFTDKHDQVATLIKNLNREDVARCHAPFF
jgi:hypothetical protein